MKNFIYILHSLRKYTFIIFIIIFSIIHTVEINKISSLERKNRYLYYWIESNRSSIDDQKNNISKTNNEAGDIFKKLDSILDQLDLLSKQFSDNNIDISTLDSNYREIDFELDRIKNLLDEMRN